MPRGRTGRRSKRKVKVKMAKDKYYGKTLRKNFARHEEVMPMPNLLEIQKTSYREFLAVSYTHLTLPTILAV